MSSIVVFDDDFKARQAIAQENRRCGWKLRNVTALVLVVAGIMFLLGTTQVPFLSGPLQAVVDGVRDVLGMMLGVVWLGISTVATLAWEWALRPIAVGVVTTVIYAGNAAADLFGWIYTVTAAYSPFSGAVLTGTTKHGETVTVVVSMVPIWLAAVPFLLAAWAIHSALLRSWFERYTNGWLVGIVILGAVCLVADISGFWLYHMDKVMNAGIAGPFWEMGTAVLSFVVMFGVGIWWTIYFEKLSDIVRELKIRVEEPGWVENLRLGIVAGVPLVLMSGAYLGAVYGGTWGRVAMGAALTSLAYAWAIKGTITCGYYPRSEFRSMGRTTNRVIEGSAQDDDPLLEP